MGPEVMEISAAECDEMIKRGGQGIEGLDQSSRFCREHGRSDLSEIYERQKMDYNKRIGLQKMVKNVQIYKQTL